MRPRSPRVTRVIAAVALAASGLLATGIAGASTPASQNWGAPTPITAPSGGFSLLSGISCTSASNCTAVGQDVVSNQPIYVVETDGVWGAPVTVTMGSGDEGGSLNAVSCFSPGNCTAVGASSNSNSINGPIYAVETAGVWGSTVDLGAGATQPSFTAISCTAVAECTAVGKGVNGLPSFATQTGANWSSPAELSAANSTGFTGISCTSATECTAVGGMTDNWGTFLPLVASSTGGAWSAPVSLETAPNAGYNSELQSVGCWNSTSCLAIGSDHDGNLTSAVENSGTWSGVTHFPVALAADFRSLTCYSSGSCTAMGATRDYPSQYFSMDYVSGAWSEPMYFGSMDTGLLITSAMSCNDLTHCTAVGANFIEGTLVSVTSPPVAPGGPAAPTLASVKAKAHQITASWVAPSTTVGPVKSYTATATNLATGSPAGSCTVRSQSRSCTIRQLTDLVEYGISVTADEAPTKTTRVTTLASASLSAIPAAPIFAPWFTPADRSTRGSITFNWTPGASPDGQAFSYVATVTEGGSTVATVTTSGTTASFSGLRPGGNYRIWLTARTEASLAGLTPSPSVSHAFMAPSATITR